MSTSVSTTQLNLRIISIVVFTCICYLSIGLPLAVLPGYIHYQLGYSTFVAGIVISLQYISTLISRPHAGRYTDIWGPKKVVSLGIICCLLSGAFTLLAVLLQATPMLAIATAVSSIQQMRDAFEGVLAQMPMAPETPVRPTIAPRSMP